MQLTRLAPLALAAALLAPGCSFYFGDDDDGCDTNAPTILVQHLDPATLECVQGDVRCDHGSIVPANPYDQAECFSACTGQIESDCLRSDGCRAVYTEREVFDPNAWVRVYGGCFPTAPSGPVRGGGCAGLDAQACSQHDDCAAVHENVPGAFASCIDEPSFCVPSPMPPPLPTPPLRNPATGKCESVGGGGGGGGCGTGVDIPVPPLPDWGVCGSPCEALDETSCKAADACRAIYANDVPPNADGFHLVFEACWPTAPSGPVRGGGCEGLDAQECSRHDDCVAQHDSDWSACPDFSHCDFSAGAFLACAAETTPPPPPPACATLAEAACVGRADCTPLYAGDDCDCSPAGCTCHTWTFDRCSDGP